MNLSRRSDLAEAMDDPALDPAVYARCIGDLAKVNRVTFTHRPVLRWLTAATRDLPKGDGFSLLDVAFGNGDLLRAIRRWANRRGLAARLGGIDLNPRSAVAAREATPAGMDIEYRTGDVFDYAPMPEPDFIVTSQFAHHLDDEGVARLLGWLDRYAARGWYVADLHRHEVPYYGFRALAWLMGWHRIVASDGTISIARGFRHEDWTATLAYAGLTTAAVTWHFPFRYGVSRLK